MNCMIWSNSRLLILIFIAPNWRSMNWTSLLFLRAQPAILAATLQRQWKAFGNCTLLATFQLSHLQWATSQFKRNLLIKW